MIVLCCVCIAPVTAKRSTRRYCSARCRKLAFIERLWPSPDLSTPAEPGSIRAALEAGHTPDQLATPAAVQARYLAHVVDTVPTWVPNYASIVGEMRDAVNTFNNESETR